MFRENASLYAQSTPPTLDITACARRGLDPVEPSCGEALTPFSRIAVLLCFNTSYLPVVKETSLEVVSA